MTGRTSVLGLGNPLYGDDGVGVAVLQRLRRTAGLSDEVDTLDGGTQGLYLLPHVQAARRLLVLDAIDIGAAPGTVVVRRDGELPRRANGAKLDAHQASFLEVLQAAELLGEVPETLVLVGVQPARTGPFGAGLSEPVADSLDDAVARARTVLADWGVLARATAET